MTTNHCPSLRTESLRTQQGAKSDAGSYCTFLILRSMDTSSCGIISWCFIRFNCSVLDTSLSFSFSFYTALQGFLVYFVKIESNSIANQLFMCKYAQEKGRECRPHKYFKCVSWCPRLNGHFRPHFTSYSKTLPPLAPFFLS